MNGWEGRKLKIGRRGRRGDCVHENDLSLEYHILLDFERMRSRCEVKL